MRADRPHVAIVGGGIGGLAAAIALAADGVGVTVLERTPAYTAAGSALELGPNAVRILADFGLLEPLRRASVRPDGSQFLRWQDGTVLQETPLGVRAEEYFGAPLLCFHRAELLDVLVDALPTGCLRLNATVVGVEQDEHGIDAVLTSGERIHADVLIAADGIRSGIRQRLVGADHPVYSGTVVYRGNVPADRCDGLGLSNVKRYWLGPNRHVVSYWLSGGHTHGVAVAVQRREEAAESWTELATVDETLAYIQGWDPRIHALIRGADALIRTAVYVRSPLEQWVYGRVALLGDAAHAMVPFQGQGAATSIEDAAVLAGCLAGRSRDDVTPALRRYETLTMERAVEQQESSRGSGDFMNLPDGPEQQARDGALAQGDPAQPFGGRQKTWEYDARARLIVDA